MQAYTRQAGEGTEKGAGVAGMSTVNNNNNNNNNNIVVVVVLGLVILCKLLQPGWGVGAGTSQCYIIRGRRGFINVI